MSTLSIFFFNGFDLALFFGDLNQREKLSQIKPPYFSQAHMFYIFNIGRNISTVH